MKAKLKVITAALVSCGVLAASTVPGVTREIDQALKDQIDACVTTQMQAGAVPGATVAVVIDGEIAYQKAFGVKNRDSGEPVEIETIFRTGSIQKMMTSAAVLTQVERGLVDLDEKVVALIPELHFAGRFKEEKIEVSDLLTHTAAVPDLLELNCSTDETTLSTWAGSLGDVSLYAPAGSFWNYSNAGYSLAGLVAERAAGKPYRQLMRESIWGPARMTRTFASGTEAIAAGNFSFGHSTDDETGLPKIYAPADYQCGWSDPAGTAFTTAGDLARWAIVLMNEGGDVLSTQSARALQKPRVSTKFLPGEQYGYGVSTEFFGKSLIHWHDGGIPGWASYLGWIPEKRFAVAVLDNADVEVNSVGECVIKAATGLQRPPFGDLTTPRKAWQKFTGLYDVRIQTGEEIPVYVTLPRDSRVLRIGVPDLKTGVLAWHDGPQLFLDTFYIDLDDDGQPNDLELITFINVSREGGKNSTWMRNRAYVGQRVGKLKPGEGEASRPLPRLSAAELDD